MSNLQKNCCFIEEYETTLSESCAGGVVSKVAGEDAGDCSSEDSSVSLDMLPDSFSEGSSSSMMPVWDGSPAICVTDDTTKSNTGKK